MSRAPRFSIHRIVLALAILLSAGFVVHGPNGTAAANQKTSGKSKPSSVEAQIRGKLAEPVTLEFVETPLVDAVDFLKDFTGQFIVLDEAALEKAGIAKNAAVNLKVSRISAGSALKHLLRQHGAEFVIQDNVVMVTSADRATKREFKVAAKLLKDAEKKIQQELKPPCEVDFNETSLADAINFLRDVSGQNMVFDTKAMSAAGIALDAPVTLKLQGKSMDDTLKQLLAKVKATYVIDHEVVLIQPAGKAKTKK